MTKVRNVGEAAIEVDGFRLEPGDSVWVSDLAAESVIRATRTVVVVL